MGEDSLEKDSAARDIPASLTFLEDISILFQRLLGPEIRSPRWGLNWLFLLRCQPQIRTSQKVFPSEFLFSSFIAADWMLLRVRNFPIWGFGLESTVLWTINIRKIPENFLPGHLKSIILHGMKARHVCGCSATAPISFLVSISQLHYSLQFDTEIILMFLFV